jgi:hypothetical protein
LEDNQEAFASGPCLHTFASGQPAVIDDVRGDTVRRGDPAQVLLDLVYRLPSGGEDAAKVEQELWYGPHSSQQFLHLAHAPDGRVTAGSGCRCSPYAR